MNPKSITPADAAKLLGISRQRVMQLIAAGRIRTGGKFGSTILVDRASVLSRKKMMKKNGKGK